ncbi:MAG: LON peptidase substrate-binding domain-containing protein [Acidimicrobiales bacterium]
MPVLPMFPLGSVLLPSAVLPLHVFEPRYRRLTEDCLEGVPEFGVVLIERGSEVGGGDQRTMVGTVARIVEAASFDDGRYALGTVGVRRIKVLRWLDDDPYPRAEVEDWADPEPGPGLVGASASVTATLRRVLALSAELGAAAAPATVELSEDPVLPPTRSWPWRRSARPIARTCSRRRPPRPGSCRSAACSRRS